MVKAQNFDTFKERFKQVGKQKTADLDYLSAKGFCCAALIKYDEKKFGKYQPYRIITLSAEDKLRKKYPEIPSMSTTTGATLGAGIGYFVNKELGIDFNEKKSKENLTKTNIKDKFDDADPEDQSIWKKNMLGDLTPRAQYKFTTQEVIQAVKEAIVEYGTKYAAEHSRLAQAHSQAASRQSSVDSDSVATPRVSESSLSSLKTDSDEEENEEKSNFTP